MTISPVCLRLRRARRLGGTVLCVGLLASQPACDDNSDTGTDGSGTSGQQGSTTGGTDTGSSEVVAPSDLMAHVLPTGIHLIWTDNSLDEIHFMVQRKEGAGEFAEHLATSAPDVNMIMDEMVVDAGVYTYRVRAMSAAGLSAFSNEIQATASIPDAETSGTGGDTGSGGDTVTGEESGTADGTDATTTQSESGGDTTADADTGASSDDTGADEIAAPSDLVLHNLPSAFHMVWADNSDNETNFVIERKVGAGPYEVRTTLPANTTAFHEAEVVSGTTYTYRIMATGADGQMSPYSEEVEQTAT